METVRDRHGWRGEGACVPVAALGSSISRHQPRCLGVAPSAAGVLRPGPAAPSHSDQWTHPGIVNVGEAGRGELIVQPVVPAAVAGHVDFQGVESFPVLPERCLRAGTGVWQRISP